MTPTNTPNWGSDRPRRPAGPGAGEPASTEIHPCSKLRKSTKPITPFPRFRCRPEASGHVAQSLFRRLRREKPLFSELPPEKRRRYFQENSFPRGAGCAAGRRSDYEFRQLSRPGTIHRRRGRFRRSGRIFISICLLRPRFSPSAMITACCRCSFLKAVKRPSALRSLCRQTFTGSSLRPKARSGWPRPAAPPKSPPPQRRTNA